MQHPVEVQSLRWLPLSLSLNQILLSETPPVFEIAPSPPPCLEDSSAFCFSTLPSLSISDTKKTTRIFLVENILVLDSSTCLLHSLGQLAKLHPAKKGKDTLRGFYHSTLRLLVSLHHQLSGSLSYSKVSLKKCYQA